MTIQQAKERLTDLRVKRKELDQQINALRFFIADSTNHEQGKDKRKRDKKIYLDWKRNLVKGKRGWRLQLFLKYNLGVDRLREIYNQQKAIQLKE